MSLSKEQSNYLLSAGVGLLIGAAVVYLLKQNPNPPSNDTKSP